jgi:hypothetical protein
MAGEWSGGSNYRAHPAQGAGRECLVLRLCLDRRTALLAWTNWLLATVQLDFASHVAADRRSRQGSAKRWPGMNSTSSASLPPLPQPGMKHQPCVHITSRSRCACLSTIAYEIALHSQLRNLRTASLQSLKVPLGKVKRVS